MLKKAESGNSDLIFKFSFAIFISREKGIFCYERIYSMEKN